MKQLRLGHLRHYEIIDAVDLCSYLMSKIAFDPAKRTGPCGTGASISRSTRLGYSPAAK